MPKSQCIGLLAEATLLLKSWWSVADAGDAVEVIAGAVTLQAPAQPHVSQHPVSTQLWPIPYPMADEQPPEVAQQQQPPVTVQQPAVPALQPPVAVQQGSASTRRRPPPPIRQRSRLGARESAGQAGAVGQAREVVQAGAVGQTSAVAHADAVAQTGAVAEAALPAEPAMGVAAAANLSERNNHYRRGKRSLAQGAMQPPGVRRRLEANQGARDSSEEWAQPVALSGNELDVDCNRLVVLSFVLS